MNDDEKLDLILNKLSAMESRIEKVENKSINVNIASDPIREEKRDDSRYYWTVGVLGVIGFIVLYNIILFVVEVYMGIIEQNKAMTTSFIISAFVTLIFCYTLIMNRKEKSEERLSSEK